MVGSILNTGLTVHGGNKRICFIENTTTDRLDVFVAHTNTHTHGQATTLAAPPSSGSVCR